jgi:DnaJ-class molecular chaperone
VVEDSDDGEHKSAEDEDESGGKGEADYASKKPKKTKEQIEKEALVLGDLYACLGLEDFKFVTTEAQVTKAYRKMALVFHPDKLGNDDEYVVTQKDKDVWVTI